MPSKDSEPIIAAAPPWTLKGTVYSFMVHSSSKDAKSLASNKTFLYSPLEMNSSFAHGKFLGGLGSVQIIRYTESPVGPYDELLLVPGTFGYNVNTSRKDGSVKIQEKKNLRVTQIYVSQKHTCWNGRKNWNIPKHLARFKFEEIPGTGTQISVYPYEADLSGIESEPSRRPFFSAIYKPVSYLPSFPMSTLAAKYVGFDLLLVQPPLPTGKGEELPGTEDWCAIMPLQASKKASLGWWDMTMKCVDESSSPLEGGGNEGGEVKHENFWPGIGKWRIGMKMEDATIEFPEGLKWVGPNL